jgi:hypothetical protein
MSVGHPRMEPLTVGENDECDFGCECGMLLVMILLRMVPEVVAAMAGGAI